MTSEFDTYDHPLLAFNHIFPQQFVNCREYQTVLCILNASLYHQSIFVFEVSSNKALYGICGSGRLYCIFLFVIILYFPKLRIVRRLYSIFFNFETLKIIDKFYLLIIHSKLEKQLRVNAVKRLEFDMIYIKKKN